MLTVVCADKGAPGTTSTALALAAGWGAPAILVEADHSGGDLGIRIRRPDGSALPEKPTVATLAAAARPEPQAPALARTYAHKVHDNLSVLPGYLVAEQGGGLAQLWDPLAISLESSDTDILVDVGRIHSGAPTLRLAEAADVVVLVGRANLASIIHMRERLNHLVSSLARGRRRPPTVIPLLVTAHRQAEKDLSDLAEILQVAGLTTAAPAYVAWDPAALARLEDGEDPNGRLSRSILLRSARDAAEQIRSNSSAPSTFASSGGVA